MLIILLTQITRGLLILLYLESWYLFISPILFIEVPGFLRIET
jgi:hypothetical protein